MPPAVPAQTPAPSTVEQLSRTRRRGPLTIGLIALVGLALFVACATVVGRACSLRTSET